MKRLVQNTNPEILHPVRYHICKNSDVCYESIT
jgi:hypothetical protein